nr:PREDICTED: mucin-19-like [Lepisosteus oculatus]
MKLLSELTLVAVLFLLSGKTSSASDAYSDVCKTFGSGIIQTFNGTYFHVKSTCQFTFSKQGTDYDIQIQRDEDGFLAKVIIFLNNIETILEKGQINVEGKNVNLPYDHKYLHIHEYGIYTQLESRTKKLSLFWYDEGGYISSLWLELDEERRKESVGLCGSYELPDDSKKLISEYQISNGNQCETKDENTECNEEHCQDVISEYFMDCVDNPDTFIDLCATNACGYKNKTKFECSLYEELTQICIEENIYLSTYTGCGEPTCSGDLIFTKSGKAFMETCSNPSTPSNVPFTKTCTCPTGKVLNDHVGKKQCVKLEDCPCVFAGKVYQAGYNLATKCQKCVCKDGKWDCSQKNCPSRCKIEGIFVTTFDGKDYRIPGPCKYFVAQGLNWTLAVEFSKKQIYLSSVKLEINKELYEFSISDKNNLEKYEFYKSEHLKTFRQSSMYIQVETSFGLKMQIQVSPLMQLYLTLPEKLKGTTNGLCGNYDDDIKNEFTASNHIIENSADEFANSWVSGTCEDKIPTICTNTPNDLYGKKNCDYIKDPTGPFAKCHDYVQYDNYIRTCEESVCHCAENVQDCLCTALGNYAKACAAQGIIVEDWRKDDCIVSCPKNQKFEYIMTACNRTCRSLSVYDFTCEIKDDPVEGCGCSEGSHMDNEQTCTSTFQCPCYHGNDIYKRGTFDIAGYQSCNCEDGILDCSPKQNCTKEKIFVYCAHSSVSTSQKTCDSLNLPKHTSEECQSGCYCPEGKYEDHNGNCVPHEDCTCTYSGQVYKPGEKLNLHCQKCICQDGKWICVVNDCSGKCQVYGDGHYQTFDLKSYRFDGNCEYTLVEDDCGNGNGTFEIKAESVPCCDEALTCSRAIVLDIKDQVTLKLSDMNVTINSQNPNSCEIEPVYSVHTVGLYIIITVPKLGITLVWDKHTRVTILLASKWINEVCGLCGNFDSNAKNDLQTRSKLSVTKELEFGNSWKTSGAACSDTVNETFPCERHSYCFTWAERRCRMILEKTFEKCHSKVDPKYYYEVCVQESCSCEFEGKFLGFCTTVAAYAEACSEEGVCIQWRTPDLCPVYCDYYNNPGECSWHYDPCGKVKTCGKNNKFTGKLEGCYPRCPDDTPYFDENTMKCTTLGDCSCFYNENIIEPNQTMKICGQTCYCLNGTLNCIFTTTPTTPTGNY